MQPGAEWLEADGLGGFASGPVAGPRTRRYHAILLTATTPPTGRFVLVNGFDAWVETPQGRFELTAQRYAPDVVHPAAAHRLVDFSHEPWPRWTYRLENGLEITHELVVPRGAPVAILTWSAHGPRTDARLVVRPFLSGRDTHATHHENDAFRFDASVEPERIVWHPYAELPAVISLSNARYEHAPEWYRNFQYDEERTRGLDFLEDLAAPGKLTFDLEHGEASWILAAAGAESERLLEDNGGAVALTQRLRTVERLRRSAFPTPLHRAADQYVVRRGSGASVIAGYPWFSDWGRDTFIAVRGLCIATGRLEDARAILLAWADTVSDGMLPNYFPEQGHAPEYNSVDASLWYIVAIHDFLAACERNRHPLTATDRAALEHAVTKILNGYTRGTRFGIEADDDCLIAAGVPGVQLTWMDARVGDRVITPRVGKPVEVQALWINALRIGCEIDGAWEPVLQQARKSFAERFWNESRGYLYDVIDVDHDAGVVDASLRPNQLLAVGGLPFALLGGDAQSRRRALSVVAAVESKLWTPLGPRSLAADEPGYIPQYVGGVSERDGAYHQGTVWPWLAGPFIEAWIRVHGTTHEVKEEARQRFLMPLLKHLEDAGIGHISEIADAEAPYSPRGCPFQAWSLGEVLRVMHGVLSERPRVLGVSLAAGEGA
jgi:predicted glycogen debranching enzyme